MPTKEDACKWMEDLYSNCNANDSYAQGYLKFPILLNQNE
jgi:hypothetical protein